MKVERTKIKKGTDLSVDCKNLIDRLKKCNRHQLKQELARIQSWTFGKCELYHWVDVLDIFDDILGEATIALDETTNIVEFDLTPGEIELLLLVLNFTTLQIEHSFSRHLYNSVDHLIALLSSFRMDVALGVLNLFYMFSKRSNFIARLSADKKTTLLNRLKFLAENWGFGLANCCKPDSEFNEKFDQGFYYQFYTKDGNLESIEIKNIKQFKQTHTASTFTKYVWNLIIEKNGLLDEDQKFHILSRVRLLWQFDSAKHRLLFVQARLQALSVLVYSDALSEQTHSLIYPGLLEEIVDLIKYDIKSSQYEESLVEIRAAALRTLTSIIHLERNTQYIRKSESRLSIIIDVTGASSYHGFLPSLVRSCINNLISEQDTSASLQKLATALFSFLYHLASYESGAESLVSCGMMEPLLRVINWKSIELDHITFVTRAVRVIDLITNLDMQSFQQLDGLNIFVDRLNIEISLCRKETPYEIVPKRFANPEESPPHQPAAAEMAPIEPVESMVFEELEESPEQMVTARDEPEIDDDRKPINRVKHYLRNQRSASLYDADLYALQKKPIGHDNTKAKNTDKACLPQRAALLKSMLNFLKKAIQDSVFSESIRQVMDGSLPNSLKHIISNAEYYGPSLFLLATDVATVYVYHEPSLLSSLQDNGLTDVILQALLAKDVPATREVLGSLPNIFGALCLNERGLNEFLHYRPFDMLSRIFLSPVYLNAMRRRRSAEPGDTAAIFGKAMDDLMRNQTSLKEEAIKAIIKLLKDLRFLGTHPQFVCWRGHKSEAASSNSTHDNSNSNDLGNGSGDEDDEDEEVTSPQNEVGDDFPNEDSINNNDDDDNNDIVMYESEMSNVANDNASSSMSEIDLNVYPERTPVSLIDYILNVMKFVDAILNSSNNNATNNDDHCREFIHQNGLNALLSILSLPNLPVTSCNSPITASVQMISTVCKSILSLTQDPQVLRVALEQLNGIIETLDPLLIHLKETKGSVLLRELANCQFLDQAFTCSIYTPILHTMGAVYSYIAMLVLLCRTTQSEMRSSLLMRWAQDERGLALLSKLAQLYEALVWESTLLLALCTDDIIPQDCDFGREDMEKLIKGTTKISNSDVSWEEIVGNLSTIESNEVSVDGPEQTDEEMNIPTGTAATAAFVAAREPKDFDKKRNEQLKYIKSSLGASSRLGRALAELFGILVKSSVALLQRPRRNMPTIPSYISGAAKEISNVLSNVVVEGLKFDKLPESPIPKLKLTFLICSVGFTSAMLFDEKKNSYQLMLSKFVEKDGLDVFFQMFYWVINSGKNEEFLLEGTNEFLDAWIALLEKMTNVKAILETPHGLWDMENQFTPINYLAQIHRMAFQVLTKLWYSNRIYDFGNKTVEIILTIFKHIFKGESVIKEKLKKTETGEKEGETSTAAPANPTTRENFVNQSHLQQLIDMGFNRETAVFALSNSLSLEMATDFLLSQPNLGEIGRTPTTNAIAAIQTAQTSTENKPTPISQEEIEEFINNVLKMAFELLEKFPGSVHKLCDLMLAIFKRNGEQFRNQSINQILVRIQSDLEVAENILQTMHNIESELYPEHLPARLQFLTLLFEAKNQDMKVPCATIMDDSSFIQILHNMITLYREMEKRMTKSFRTPKWVAPLFLLIDLYDKATNYGKNKGKLYEITTGKWRWYDVQHGRWKTYYNSNNKVIGAAYWAGEQTVRITADRHHYTINFNCMSQVNEGSGNHRPIIPSLKCMESNEFLKLPEVFGAGATGGPSSDNSTNKSSGFRGGNTESDDSSKATGNLLESSQCAVVLNKIDTSQWLVNDDMIDLMGGTNCPIGEKYTKAVLRGIDYKRAEDLIRSCVTLMTTDIDPDTLHSVMKLCVRLTRDYEIAQLFARLGGVKLLLSIKASSSFVGFFTLAALLIRHILEDQTNLEYAMANVLRCKTLSTIPPGYKELFYLTRQISSAVSRSPKVFTDVATKILRLTNTIEYSTPESPKLFRGFFLKSVSYDYKTGKYNNEVAVEAVHSLLAALAKIDYLDNSDPKFTPILMRVSILKILTEAVKSYLTVGVMIAEHKLKDNMSAMAFIMDHLLHMNSERECSQMAINLITAIVASMETQPFNMQYKVVFEVKEAFDRATTLPKATDRHGQIESMAILIQSIIDHLSSVDQNIPRSTKHSSVLGIMLEIGLIADIANAIKYLDLSGTQVVQTINHLLKPLELMVRIFNEQCSEDDSNKKKAEKEKESQTQTVATLTTEREEEPDAEEEDADEEFPTLVEQEQPEDEMEYLEDSNDMDVGERNEEEGTENEGAEETNQDNNQEERSESGETESNASEEQVNRENEAEDEAEDGGEERSELDVDEETRQFIEIVGGDQVMLRYHPMFPSNDREDDNETANNERSSDDTFRSSTSRFILRRNIVGNDGRSRVNHSGHVSQILNDMASTSSTIASTTRHSNPHRTFIQHLLPDSSNDSNGSRNIRITTRVRLPRNHSQVLERLFGPLPITTSSNSVRGSGRLNGNTFRDATRVVLMDNGFGIVPSSENLSVQMVDQSGYLFGRSLNAQLSNNPTALHWWIEENKILGLESQSELCLIVCDEIFPILQKLRMEELEKEEKKKNDKNSDEKSSENLGSKGQPSCTTSGSRSGGILSELLHMIRVTSSTSSTTSTLATPMEQGSVEPVDLNNLNIDNDHNQTDNERENAANANDSVASNNQTTETSRGFDFFNPSFDEDSRNANDEHEHDHDHDQDEEVQESDASDDILTPMIENQQNYDNESDDGEDEEEEEEDEDGDNGDDDDDDEDDDVVEEDETPREITNEGNQQQQNDQEVSASTNSSGRVMLGDLEVPEGIDPSFLEAIPDGMRAEVIADYMRLQGLNRPQPPPPAPDPDPDVLAEFMAALPPNIQEELRMDRLRQAASTSNPNEPVDAGAFFQNLPPSLRQSILSDMEDSQISALPPDLAAEAATLRRDWETRNRATLAQATGNPMMRFRNLRTLIPRTGLIHLNPESFSIRSSIQQNLALESYIQRQEKPALDHEALTSILLLLFIDNANLSNVRLFKIIRFLCYHVPTRKWIITTLLSIIQRCSMKSRDLGEQKKPIPGLSIYLHTALGYKAHVFSIGKNCVDIHPKATAIICRQAVELLIMLAKSFPWQFLPSRKAPFAKKKSSSNIATIATIATPTTNAKDESQQPSTSYKSQKDKKSKDFWDILARVGSSREQLGPATVPKEFDESEIHTYEESPFFALINMLAFNSIKMSNQLTDKLLRLLSLITFAMPEEDKTKNLAQPNSETHLRIAVDVLTSKSCSEDGLEDATAVLIALSQCSSKAGSLIYSLLIQSAINISETVHKQIEALCEELQKTDVSPTSDLNDDTAKIDITEREDEEMPSTSSSTKSHSSGKRGLLEDRFTKNLVVVNAPTRVKSSSDLQLLSIEPLTSKTSSQTLFLRILKVITQIRDSLKNDKEKVEPLSTTLNLEELWGTLSVCLKDLEEKSDNHAILILQPVVEAFFIVHSSSQTKRSATETPPTNDTNTAAAPVVADGEASALATAIASAYSSNQDQPESAEQQPQDTDIEQNTNNEQNEEQPANETNENAMIIAPVSPISADVFTPLPEGNVPEHTESSVQSSSSNTQQNLTADQKKFLLFAETHRIILNQILRQSSMHLADGPFSVLVDHTRVLDFDVKRRYFRTELERLDEGVRRDELQINVRRASVFEDSFRELCRKSPEEWKNRFYIVFEGEEGQDAGGLLREWYVIISRDIFNPMYALFTVSPGDRVTYMINSSSHVNPNHLHYFKFVGRLIAKAIYDNKLLECYFTRAFYKHILGIQVKYTDMESEDYDFYKGLVFLMENTVSMLGYDLTFSLEVQEFGVTEVRDLIPNGRHVTVTEENKLDYIHLVCQLKMSGSIKQQLNAFLEGFYDIIPKNLISIFNEQELELLISGLPNIDIEDLRANTEYHKYEVNSRQIQWFWRALRSFNQAERAKFLQFVTGTSKVPLQGFGSLEGMNGTQKFQIHRDDRSTDHLPSAHTCFNQLDLPAYKTYDKLRSCLLKAIQECSEGFAFA